MSTYRVILRGLGGCRKSLLTSPCLYGNEGSDHGLNSWWLGGRALFQAAGSLSNPFGALCAIQARCAAPKPSRGVKGHGCSHQANIYLPSISVFHITSTLLPKKKGLAAQSPETQRLKASPCIARHTMPTCWEERRAGDARTWFTLCFLPPEMLLIPRAAPSRSPSSA